MRKAIHDVLTGSTQRRFKLAKLLYAMSFWLTLPEGDYRRRHFADWRMK
jgi:hypothetical protein